MRQQTKNTILFAVLMVLCFLIWLGLKTWFKPPEPPAPPPPPPPSETYEAAADLGVRAAGPWQALARRRRRLWMPSRRRLRPPAADV